MKAPTRKFRASLPGATAFSVGARLPLTRALLWLCVVTGPALALRAQDDVANEARQTIAFAHPIKGALTGFGSLEFRENSDQGYKDVAVAWPGVNYLLQPRVQLTAGLFTLFTDNQKSADKLELRPSVGVKYFLQNKERWNIYNYTRYEYRDTENRTTGAWTAYSRVRSRFGVEFHLTSLAQAWKPNTWYGLADVEPIYRFDHDTIDPVYLRGGIGYILHNRARVEFIYWTEFTRTSAGQLLRTNNIFQVDIKIGLSEGILERVRNPRVDK